MEQQLKSIASVRTLESFQKRTERQPLDEEPAERLSFSRSLSRTFWLSVRFDGFFNQMYRFFLRSPEKQVLINQQQLPGRFQSSLRYWYTERGCGDAKRGNSTNYGSKKT